MRGVPTRGRGRSGRNKSERALLKAFEALLRRNGPNGVGVNAVLQSAKVGKRLLYEYFGDLDGLALAWARHRHDPLGLNGSRATVRARAQAVPQARRIAVILGDYATRLKDHPWAAQILLAEMNQPHTFTRALREIRRQMGTSHESLLTDLRAYENKDLAALSFVLNAAASYLALRAKFAPDYHGHDLHTRAGWDAALAMLDQVAGRVKTAAAPRIRAKSTLSAATRRRLRTASSSRRARGDLVQPGSGHHTALHR
jgi:AcrR family transcriptional regulator